MLLPTFRVLLTGEVRAQSPTLLDLVDAPGCLPELTAAEAEREHGTATVDHERAEADVERPHTALDEARATSALPDAATAQDAPHDRVVRLRLER
ncbi:hypothetical protein [Streptomyces pyxinicus]|uniref:hypothetical protein n=1 Tax=Streptomyces pyxinicus TaxID=2970331 RepID=UPI003D1790BB